MSLKSVLVLVLLVPAIGYWGLLGRGDEKEKPIPAPEFTGVTEWVNAKPMKLADQKGKVLVIHFWTNGCINCINNYPHYRAWQDKYKDQKDLVIVGIHTPEFKAERDVDRIKDRMAKNKLTFAVAVDNDGANWKAWGNRYWPCVYLVDKAGNVRQHWEGELGDDGFKTLTRTIDALLTEQPKGK
jgi:thiol-disulfide isomerase/thioredoxin